MIAQYETDTGKVLQPAQVERLVINMVAYREMVIRNAIQDAAKQNLVAFARAPMLDYLGELVGVTRTPALEATVLIRFNATTTAHSGIVIPAGTRVQTRDGKLVFATTADKSLPAGAGFGLATLRCQTAGDAGNGYAPADVNVILDPVAGISGVEQASSTPSGGGADEETDDQLRKRIKLAPDQFSVAGSKGAYRYYALSASADVIDVAVTSPNGGIVNVYLLTSAGLPSSQVKSLVSATLSADKVRPLTDTVQVLDPTPRSWSLNATIQLYPTADPSTTLAAAQAAAQAYADGVKAKLGKDVVPSQIVSALSVDGVYQVIVSSPSASVVVAENEFASATSVTVNLGSVVDG
jgi:phage-related baseplate assembly protein